MSVAKLTYEHKQARGEKTPNANSPGDWIVYSGAWYFRVVSMELAWDHHYWA